MLELWHLLSLDAPTVAAVWTYFVADCCHLTLPWTSPVAMFLGVWMLYAADRLLDTRAARGSKSEPVLEERHRFHAKYQARFLAGIAVCAVILPAFLFYAERQELQWYTALGSLLFAYFFLIHLWPFTAATSNSNRLPKELAVGIFFAAAVFIPTVSRAPWLRLGLLPSAWLFASICTLNCLYIYAWEHPDFRAAHWTTRFALRSLAVLTLAVLAISALIGSLTATLHIALPITAAALPAACCISAAGFLLLQNLHRTMQRTTLRAAVDFALLTPLLFEPFLHLHR